MLVSCLPLQSHTLQTLARNLKLALLENESDLSQYTFFLQEINGLVYLAPTDKSKGAGIACDFNSPECNRHRKSTGIQNPLAKAVGCKPGFRPKILDVTAGFGGDSFILASMGCQLTLLEKNPVVYLLLYSGLRQALKGNNEVTDIIDNYITLLPCQPSSSFLMNGNPSDFHCVYIDPMFPERKKSSKVKKNMQYFHEVVGADDNDADSLFQLSMANTTNRVVIKRPKGADYFVNKKPDYQIHTKTLRFDVYLKL